MSILTRRYRGFRVINLIGLGLLVSMVLGVYLFKTLAWRERNDIAAVDVQIHQEQLRIRLLQAEVAHLEEPRRLETLSSGSLGMAPIGPKQEITLADLPRLAHIAPQPAVMTATTPASAAVLHPTSVAVADVSPGLGAQPPVSRQ